MQFVAIVLMSQLVACGSAGFPAADLPAVPISIGVPVVMDSLPARPALQPAWQISGNPNAFDVPTGVAADAEGNIYVMDTNNSRVQKFDNQGNFLLAWGSAGSGEGQFGDILDPREGRLAVDAQGNVYVIDLKNLRVQKFSSDGDYLTQWGTKGPGKGQFAGPVDIAVDRQNNVYVADVRTGTIQKFDETGRFLLRWGRAGYDEGRFSNLLSVAIAPDGNVLVTDATGRIQKFDSHGRYLSTIQPEPIDNQSVYLGSIAVDHQGNIYVADWYGARIAKFDPDGKALAAWTGTDVGLNSFVNLQDIAVDQQGNIYLTDGTEDLVRKFQQPAADS
jgi:DNA-binding beta-propeller fold protein YncE